MSVTGLHRGQTASRIIRTEGGKQSPSGLATIRKKVLYEYAVVLQSIKKGSQSNAVNRTADESPVQRFNKEQKNIGRLIESDTGLYFLCSYQGILRKRKRFSSRKKRLSHRYGCRPREGGIENRTRLLLPGKRRQGLPIGIRTNSLL